jgi:hypothetical protein
VVTVLTAHLREIRRRFVSEIPVPVFQRTREACVPYLKPIVAGLIASVVTYFCFLARLHRKTVYSGEARKDLF